MPSVKIKCYDLDPRAYGTARVLPGTYIGLFTTRILWNKKRMVLDEVYLCWSDKQKVKQRNVPDAMRSRL